MLLEQYKQLDSFLNIRGEKLNIDELIKFAELLKLYREDILEEIQLAEEEAIRIWNECSISGVATGANEPMRKGV